jgi:uncharacterized membrane protein YebE (DUF533 family)
MKNAKSLLDSLMGSVTELTKGAGIGDLATKAKGAWDDQSTLAKGAIAGGLLGVLLSGNARRMLGTGAKVGGMALIGGLAYKAWEDWKSGKSAGVDGEVEAAPDGTAFAPIDAAEADDLAARLLQAMVSAAKADGRVTEKERANIGAQLASLGLGNDATAMIEAELDAPMDVGRIAALASQPEDGAQLYAASLLVVDPNGAAERAYLAALADKLGLAADLVAHLHAKAASLQTAA